MKSRLPVPYPMHDKTEYEFIAKAVNDLLKDRFNEPRLMFMTFIMDEGDEGHLGYMASVNRIDAARVVMEWLTHTLVGFDRRELIKLLEELAMEVPE